MIEEEIYLDKDRISVLLESKGNLKKSLKKSLNVKLMWIQKRGKFMQDLRMEPIFFFRASSNCCK